MKKNDYKKRFIQVDRIAKIKTADMPIKHSATEPPDFQSMNALTLSKNTIKRAVVAGDNCLFALPRNTDALSSKKHTKGF